VVTERAGMQRVALAAINQAPPSPSRVRVGHDVENVSPFKMPSPARLRPACRSPATRSPLQHGMSRRSESTSRSNWAPPTIVVPADPDVESYEAMLESECAVLLEENAQLTKQLRKVEAAREEVMDCATEMLLEKDNEVEQLRAQRNVLAAAALGIASLLGLSLYCIVTRGRE